MCKWASLETKYRLVFFSRYLLQYHLKNFAIILLKPVLGVNFDNDVYCIRNRSWMSSKPLTVQPDLNSRFGSNKLLHDRQCKYKKKDYL